MVDTMQIGKGYVKMELARGRFSDIVLGILKDLTFVIGYRLYNIRDNHLFVQKLPYPLD